MAIPPSRPQFRIEDYPDSGLSTEDALQKFFGVLAGFTDQTVTALTSLDFARNFNCEVKTITFQTPASPWTAVPASSFLNGWANTGSFTTAYRVGSGGRVYVRGNVSSGTANSAIFTLPAALKPPQDVNFATESASVFGKVVVEAATGNVRQAAGGANLSLDCINFEPASPAPYVMSCFPLDVACGLKSIAGVLLFNLYDATGGNQIPTAVGGIHQQKTSTGYRVLNIPGLVMSRKYTATLVAVGG